METDKYVPNSGQGMVNLESSLLDSLPSLDILYANECETFPVPKDFATSTEAYFYRGGQVQWLNFYLAEKEVQEYGKLGSPFIKRDVYQSVVAEVERQMRNKLSVCSVYLTHEPGSGGTTVAMQVLWDFRKRLRCAVLRDSGATVQDIAHQIIALYKAGGPRKQNTVLLFIDNLPKMDILQRGLVRHVATSHVDGNIPVVIILNCKRDIISDSQQQTDIICPQELSNHEEKQFTEKETSVRQFHGLKTEGFHSFNVMRHNFSGEFVKNVIGPIMNKVDLAAKNTKLLSIFALLNSYVPGSSLLKSECQAFLGPPDSINGGPSFEALMEPFTGLLITFSRREKLASHDLVCMAHPLIATYCCQALQAAGLTLYEMTRTLINDFDKEQRHKPLLQTVNELLVLRTTRKQFSPLIEDLRNCKPEKLQTCGCVLLKSVCEKYPRNAFLLQALARFLYLSTTQDYSQAEKYASEAKKVMPNNSFVADTLGQLHKHHLQKQTPDSLDMQLELVKKAVDAFEEQWKVAEEEAGPEDAEGTAHFFNTSGLLGFMQVASFVANEMLECLPSQEAKEMALMLKANVELPNEMVTSITLQSFRTLLTSFKDKVERTFNFFERFLTYSEQDRYLPYIRESVTSCYVKYVDLGNEFSGPGAVGIRGELKKRTAASFPGLLHCLETNKGVKDITEITKIWKKVVDLPSLADPLSDTLCYLLSNIALSCVDPESEDVLPFAELTSILHRLLKEEHCEPELYFLASMLLWPGNTDSIPSQDGGQQNNLREAGYDIDIYVAQLQKAYEQCYHKHLRSRYIRPHFFLKEGTEYSRLVHWSVVKHRLIADVKVDTQGSRAFHQWRNQAVWENAKLLRVHGVVEHRKMFACYGQRKVLVHPDSEVRSPGLVSFYLGFNIRGPIAFDIQYTSSPVQPIFSD